MDAARKARRTHALDRWIVNPIIRTGIRTGLMTSAYALLETTGRRSGEPRVVPVGNGFEPATASAGDTFWVVAQDGMRCAYVRNLIAEPKVRVKVPRQAWRTGRATVVEGIDGLAKREEINRRNGLAGRMDGIVFRTVHTELVTVRIDLD